jgi:hypothetical protein
MIALATSEGTRGAELVMTDVGMRKRVDEVDLPEAGTNPRRLAAKYHARRRSEKHIAMLSPRRASR